MKTVIALAICGLLSPVLAQDSAGCRLSGNWPFGPSKAVACDPVRGLAFCGSGGGVYVLDVSGPTRPKVLSEAIHTPGMVSGLCYRSNLLYVTALTGGLELWDVSLPDRPLKVGHLDTGCPASIALSGQHAFVVGYGGLQVVDVSNSARPRVVGWCGISGWPRGIAVVDTLAYVADGDAWVYVVNVSDPTRPTEVGRVSFGGQACWVEVSGPFAYLAAGGAGLRVINVEDPARPTEVGFYRASSTHFVKVVDSLAYVIDNGELVVLNVTDPAKPVKVGQGPPGGNAQSLGVMDSLVCIADGIRGFLVVNTAVPTRPVEAGRFRTPGGATGVTVRGQYAYLATEYSGLRVINVADPWNPVEIGAYDTPGSSYDAAVTGGRAYVADWDAGLRILDVSDPAKPSELGSFVAPGLAAQVAVVDSYVYVADPQAGLRIVNASDPAHPYETSHFDALLHVWDVAVVGSYAYLAAEYTGVCVVNVADPANPFEVGRCSLYYADRLAAVGPRLYVSDDAGFHIVNVADPANPYDEGSLDIGSGARGVAVRDSYAFVATIDGLQVFDVSDPGNPRLVAYHDAPDYRSNDVAVSGIYVYLADGDAGLQIYQFPPCRGERTGPLPDSGLRPGFATIARRSLFLPSGVVPQAWTSALLDVTGRKVLDLHPGPNDVRALAPGVYFVREESQATSLKPQAVRKVVVTR